MIPGRSCRPAGQASRQARCCPSQAVCMMPGRICQAAEQASRQAGCSARLLRPGRASYRVTWPQSWNAPFSGVGASRLGMWIARVAGLMEKWSREAWGLASCPPHGALPPPLPSPICARCLSTPTPCERVGGLSDIQNPAEAGNLTCTSRPAAGGLRPANTDAFSTGAAAAGELTASRNRGRRAGGRSQVRQALECALLGGWTETAKRVFLEGRRVDGEVET